MVPRSLTSSGIAVAVALLALAAVVHAVSDLIWRPG
jgi:hypothetical protein